MPSPLQITAILLPFFVNLIKTQQGECTVLRIITGQVTENRFCNLKMLLREQLIDKESDGFDIRPKKYSVDAIRHEVQSKAASLYCSTEDSICRVDGRRQCLCHPSFICDPNQDQSSIQRCTKLKYYEMRE